MYNGKGSFWNTFALPYQMGAQKHRIYLLDLLKDKGVTSLLDVGCGTAPIFELITNTVNEEGEGRWDNITKYKGTDYAPAMIDICEREFPYGDFETEDARELLELEEQFDCVLLLHSLDHLDDYKAAIQEAARVSSKYVCIVLWRGFLEKGTNLNNVNTMDKKEGEAPWEDTHLQEYSKEVLDQAFKEAGLIIEETAEGEQLNSEASGTNFLYLLRKI